MLVLENTVLILVDVQEKLAAAMHEREALVRNIVKIVQGAGILGIPVVCTEQNPKGLGLTLPEIAGLLTDTDPITKLSFSCCGEERFMKALKEANRKQVLIAGIESHVCVYQTAVDLLSLEYEVQALADCVSSRTPEDKAVGLERIKHLGGSITSAETALFELLKIARGDNFKQMLKVVK